MSYRTYVFLVFEIIFGLLPGFPAQRAGYRPKLRLGGRNLRGENSKMLQLTFPGMGQAPGLLKRNTR